jgi:hypothetical protein
MPFLERGNNVAFVGAKSPCACRWASRATAGDAKHLLLEAEIETGMELDGGTPRLLEDRERERRRQQLEEAKKARDGRGPAYREKSRNRENPAPHSRIASLEGWGVIRDERRNPPAAFISKQRRRGAAAGCRKHGPAEWERNMSHHWWQHMLHTARHGEHKSPKSAAVVYIVIGFFFAPMLIGIPILLYGVFLLCKD